MTELDLLVVRHGTAEAAAAGGTDAARALTPAGARRLRRLPRALQALDLVPDLLLHSPLLRAVQTAEVLARLARATEVTPLLARAPGAELLRRLRAAGAEVGGARPVLAVIGHEPWLSALVAWLALGERGALGPVSLEKGGLAWLRGPLTPGRMALRAQLPPRILGLLGG